MNNKDSSRKTVSFYPDTSEKSKNLKKIFEIHDDNLKTNRETIKYNYNQTIFFKPTDQSLREPKPHISNDNHGPDFKKIIDDVLKKTLKERKTETSAIKLNLNINNNYFESNYNVILKQARKSSDIKETRPHNSVDFNNTSNKNSPTKGKIK